MSTAEATKGKRGRPSKDAAADAVDFSGLSFEVAEKMPKRANAEPNPFEKPLGDSYETETARATTVPEVALRRVEGMLRRAAVDLEIGVSIAAGEPDKDGNVVVTFMGKPKRARKTKTEEDSAGTETTSDAPNNSETTPSTENASESSEPADREPVPVP